MPLSRQHHFIKMMQLNYKTELKFKRFVPVHFVNNERSVLEQDVEVKCKFIGVEDDRVYISPGCYKRIKHKGAQ